MFILDTNVLSAQIAPDPPRAVARWIRSHPRALLYTTAICQAEILAGVARLPAGRRREAFQSQAAALFGVDMAHRPLPFDEEAAFAYGEIVGLRQRAGQPLHGVSDLMIAAIARVHGATVVTRNTADFADCGISVVDPWMA